MGTKKSTVQPDAAQRAPATDITARTAARLAKKAAPPAEDVSAVTPLAELDDAAFLATDTPGEQVIVIRIRAGQESAYRAFGMSWAMLRAHIAEVNHSLEAQTLQGLIAAETRLATIQDAASGRTPQSQAQ